MAQKSVQIDAQLFIQLWSYFENGGTPEDADRLRKGLNDKLDAIVRRSYYTDYKTAPSAEEREKARQSYLDSVGMKDSFRW